MSAAPMNRLEQDDFGWSGRLGWRAVGLVVAVTINAAFVMTLTVGLTKPQKPEISRVLAVSLIADAAPRLDSAPPSESARPREDRTVTETPPPQVAKPPSPKPEPVKPPRHLVSRNVVAKKMEAPSAPTPPPPAAAATPPTDAAPAPAPPPRSEPIHQPATLAPSRSCRTPDYPVMSRRNNETGTVTIGFLIDVDGSVVDARIEESSGHSRLDEAAREALALCRFRPGTIDGVPRKSWTRLRYVWRLE